MEWVSWILNLLLFFVGIVLIFIISLQRGRGGGLVGALGGGGTSSAFGAKAGDTFTRVTIIMALVWIGLNVVQILVIPGGTRLPSNVTVAPSPTQPIEQQP